MITGTSYFPSFNRAVSYYAGQAGISSMRGLRSVHAVVKRKIAEGAITIGMPPVKAGQRVIGIDNNTRYGIEE